MVGASVNAGGSKHVYDNKSGAYHDGKVYMLGFTWRVYCLDAKTGKLLWHAHVGKAHEAAEKLKAEALVKKVWARLEQPGTCLDVAEGIPFAADMAGSVVAFDPATGQTLWRVAGGNPTRWTHQGRQYIVAARGTFGSDYVILDPKTGRELLKFKAGPVIQGIVLPLSGDYLLSQEPGGEKGRGTGAILCSRLGLDKVTPVWTSKDVPRPGSDGAVTFARGRAHYGAGPATGDAKQTFAWAVDLATGKVVGQTPFGMASGTTGVAVGDRVLLNNDMRHTSTALRMWGGDSFKPLGSDALWTQWHFTSNGYDSCIIFPLVDGRIFFRGMNALVCYDLRAK
jgi:outer membrane protein assembly factor BamB